MGWTPTLRALFEQPSRATLTLLDRLKGAAPRRIGYMHSEPWTAAALISRRFPEAEVVELESPISLRAPADTDLIFCHGDLERLPALRRGLPDLVARLSGGGRLAAQIPNDLYEPSRAVARLVAADGPWAPQLLPVAKTRPFGETIEQIYGRLKPVTSRLEIWETIDLCVANGVDEIVEFMKATSLAPFLAPLDERSERAFLDQYRGELARAYPAQPDGSVLLRFPHISLIAWR
ncbi:MAG: hypothetical protein ACLPN5_08340 [Roseiarcus sp.]